MDTSKLPKAIAVGVLGSLLGGVMMDLVTFLEFFLVGYPITTNLSLMGSVFGGGTFLGIVVHLVTLLSLGTVFSLAVLWIKIFRIESVLKGLGMGVFFGVVTIPAGCVPFAIMSETPVLELLTFSTIPHIVWGIGFGLVAGYKLRFSDFSALGEIPPNIS